MVFYCGEVLWYLVRVVCCYRLCLCCWFFQKLQQQLLIFCMLGILVLELSILWMWVFICLKVGVCVRCVLDLVFCFLIQDSGLLLVMFFSQVQWLVFLVVMVVFIEVVVIMLVSRQVEVSCDIVVLGSYKLWNVSMECCGFFCVEGQVVVVGLCCCCVCLLVCCIFGNFDRCGSGKCSSVYQVVSGMLISYIGSQFNYMLLLCVVGQISISVSLVSVSCCMLCSRCGLVCLMMCLVVG